MRTFQDGNMRVPVKLWADGVTVEQAAMEQIRHVASLPVVGPHVAIMPDAHWGNGACVGSVIPTKAAIIPAAVGVDIGCVDADTEYLSPTGWRRIAEYEDGLVMQYDPLAGVGEFVEPQRFVREPCSEMLRFKTKYGVDQMVTPDHRMLIWRVRGRDRRREMQVMLAADVARLHEAQVLGAKVEFETTFTPKLRTALPFTDAALRVQVIVMADGHLMSLAHGKFACQLKLRKRRKQVRARDLLEAAQIKYTEHESANGDVTFRFEPPMAVKTYAVMWTASVAQLRLIAEECLHWDGHAQDRVFYSRDEASANFIQYAFAASGWRAAVRRDVRRDGVDYRVFGHAQTRVGLAGSHKSLIERVTPQDGMKYCFTVPSGFWVMRRGGRIAMTGNCGMMAVRTDLSVNDLTGKMAAIREAIEQQIPVGGPGIRGSWDQQGATPQRVMRVWEQEFDDAYARILAKHPKLREKPTWTQLGTLGTGNHFIEVCQDLEDGGVWFMLHSGSRGVGNRIGTYFTERAKEQALKFDRAVKTDVSLAWLDEGSPLFQDYVEAVGWAQRYARRNRDLMMERVVSAVREVLGRAFRADLVAVNAHHNYVEERSGLWITRKGAVSAKLGELGIIPGSMGAKSFIVRGKGNPESFESCSHGAGRSMSRGAAKRVFTLADHAKATEGVECRKDKGVIDETPGAYKSIDAVMAAQADLVDVVATLKQLVCVKG